VFITARGAADVRPQVLHFQATWQVAIHAARQNCRVFRTDTKVLSTGGGGCFNLGHRRHHVEPVSISTPSPALIVVVDDDLSVRESLPELLRQCGFAATAFASAQDFLASNVIDQSSCLILDIAMPGMSGIELARELAKRAHPIPIVFITANRDESDRSYLLQEGAVACLFKPFGETELLQAVRLALRSDSNGVP
jgi:CheY-like chemotaxis protein